VSACRTFYVVAIAIAAGGCAIDPLGERCEGSICACAEAQRDAAGRCCPPWSAKGARGSCAPRAWSLPGEGDGAGELGAQGIALAVDGRGRAIAAWNVTESPAPPRLVIGEEEGPGALALRSPSEGLAGPERAADVAAGEDGAAIVAWVQGEGDAAIVTSARDAAGAWVDPEGPGARLSFAPNAYEPEIAMRAGGEAILVWNQWMSTGYGVAVARRASIDAPWELPAGADDVLSPHLFYSNSPQIALADGGDALVTWYQSRRRADGLREQRRGARVLATLGRRSPLRAGRPGGQPRDRQPGARAEPRRPGRDRVDAGERRGREPGLPRDPRSRRRLDGPARSRRLVLAPLGRGALPACAARDRPSDVVPGRGRRRASTPHPREDGV
jgi:hypothetical protein